MAALAALCKPHSASEQKLNTPIHSTLLDDFVMVLLYLSFHYKMYFEKVPGFGISKPKRYNLKGLRLELVGPGLKLDPENINFPGLVSDYPAELF